MKPFLASFLALLAVNPLPAQVTINEISAAPGGRALRRDAAGQPRLGTGPAWFDPAFDASSWPLGAAPLGFNAGNSGLGTNLKTVLDGQTASLYVRKVFSVSAYNAASTDNLRLRIDYNDGFVAFLNGREIARARLGAPKTFVFADQPAFSSRPSAPAGLQDFDLGPASAWLVPGDNLLAIQTANASWDGKGDLKIDAGLELNNGVLTTTEFSETFNNANGSTRTHTNTAGTISNTVTGVPPAGWFAAAPNPSSDPAWSSLTIKQTMETAGGSGNSGNLRINLAGTGPLKPARIQGPAVSMAARWPAGSVTEADLAGTTVTFKYKAPAGFTAGVLLEPASGPASGALSLGTLTGSSVPPVTEVAGWWRFEQHLSGTAAVPGSPGTVIPNAPSATGNAAAQAAAVTAGAAKYAADVPGSLILDPLTGAVYANTLSFDATSANARFAAPDNALYNTASFTIECFLKVTGEPTGYDAFLRRSQDGPGTDSATVSDRLAWQIDYDHAATRTAFGKIRSRWDTPGVSPAPLDNNRVAGGNFIFVDTPAGDGIPGNYSAAADVYTDGDQYNDPASHLWHHIAVTWDGTAKRVTIYTDYTAGASFTLNGTWTHPAAGIEFGKFTSALMPAPAGTAWPLKLDEIRYTGRVLAPGEMLKVAAPDASGFTAFTANLGDATPASRAAFLSALNSTAGQSFRPVFELVDGSFSPAPGRDLQLDDFTVTFDRPSPVIPFFQAGGTFRYRPGSGEPSNGVWEPNLPKIPNNPSEAGKPAAFPDLPEFADWIELKNTGAAPVNLSGWSLSDDPSSPGKWLFPEGTTLPAGGYRLVLCDGNSGLAGMAFLHTNFNLSEDGETIGLYRNGSPVDVLDYPRMDAFHTWGRAAADGSPGYFATATPAAPNTAAVIAERCKTPDFFAGDGITPLKGGFLSGTQTVVITSPTPGAEIRYTTDGSEPAASGTLYTGPLTLSAAANDKTGRVIRARAFKPGAVPSGVKSATFLIDQNAALKGVPALCFTGDAGQSFYRDAGIMAISGGVYDASGIWTEPVDISAYSMGLMHGRAFERPVFLEWLRNDGMPGFSEEAGVRIASSPYSRPRLKLQSTASSPWAATATEKPSFNLFFRGDYGSSALHYPLFGEDYPVKSFDQLRPRAGKNDISNPFIKDELVRRLFTGMGHKAVQGQINTLYINGSYKGFFNTVERYREPFFQAHFDSSNPWDIRIIDTTEEGDSVEWNALLTTVNRDLTVKANYDEAMARLDLDEVIDYFLLNIYCGMWDWPNNNWVASRERIPAGKWRLHVWDAEGSFGHSGTKPPNYDTILTDLRTASGTGAGGISQLFRGIYASPEVRLRFADRIHHWFFNGNLLDDRNPAACPIQARKDAMKATFAPLLQYTHGTTFNDAFWNNWTTPGTANPNQGNWTVPMSSRRSHLFSTAPVPASDISFRAHRLWPATEPAVFSQHGGVVPRGYRLTISANATVPAGSALYCTTDGSDPREWGGAVAASARICDAPFVIPGTVFTTVRARIKNAATGEWSALTEATFQFASVPATAANLVVSQLMYHPPGPSTAETAAGFSSKDDFEFLELMATGPDPVSLDNVTLTAGIAFTFGTTPAASPVRALAPGDTVLLVKNRAAFRQRYGSGLDARIAGEFSGNLNNSGEQLRISGRDGNTIRDFRYGDSGTAGWPEAADGRGPALQLINPAALPDHSLPASWTASRQWAGTPGGVTVPVSFSAWLQSHFNAAELADPAISGPEADPDHDGWSNLLEFAAGSIPDKLSGGNPGTLTAAGFTAENAALAASFTVSTQALESLTVTAEASDNITGWTSLPPLPPAVHPGGTTTLRFRGDAGAPSRRFIRFRITAAP